MVHIETYNVYLNVVNHAISTFNLHVVNHAISTEIFHENKPLLQRKNKIPPWWGGAPPGATFYDHILI